MTSYRGAVSSRLLSPVRGWEARRALRAARRRADAELLTTRLPSPRLAWRTEELVADDNRVELGRSLTDVVHSADERLLPSASPLDRASIRALRAQLLELAARLCDLSRPVAPRGVLLVDRLLHDGSGPLYSRSTPNRLRAGAAQAFAGLGRKTIAALADPASRSTRVKRVLVGRPMATGQMEETLLPKWLALPIFASDPLSSVAYATEAALVVLVAASATSLHLAFPISLAIAALLAIVVLSYRQTVLVYQSSGGAYVVAKENLGGCRASSPRRRLLTDYVLTVAVSVAAGMLALTSAVPSLSSHVLALSLACVVLISLANLRGVKEAGLLFALPTYAFVTSIFALIGVGLTKCATTGCPQATVSHPLTAGLGTVTTFVVLRAFASGSTALTGVEAIANGVNAFRRPHGKNAATTLAVLGAIAITMFVGVSWLAVQMHARPSAGGTPSVLSEIARGVFPAGAWSGFMYWVVQVLTLAVLVLAANTSYQGFPRLAALLARDRFFPRQFTNLGDRLVFSNGIVVLAGIASALLWAYNASVDSLIHLYVIGVFTAFTLSQAGMVRYWWRTREPGWRHRIVINAVGASTTGLVAIVVIWTKFAEGAWLVIVAIPLLVLSFLGINRHYRRFGPPTQCRHRRGTGGRSADERGVAVRRGDQRRHRRRTLVLAADSRRADSRRRPPAGTARAGAPHRSRHPATLVGLRRGGAAPRGVVHRRGADAGHPRGGLAPPARRVRFRHGRRPGAVQAALVALGGGARVVPPEAAPDVRAGRRRHRRPSGHTPARA